MNNNSKLSLLILITTILISIYLFINIDMNYLNYALKLRTFKLFSILIASFCIGTASMIFQSIINNRIVTPCLLGINSLYSLINVAFAFVLGMSNTLVLNQNVIFIINLTFMSGISILIYGYLFHKMEYNVLYILLFGTVLATLFSSISDTLIRTIDPNEYLALQDKLIAGFNNSKTELIAISFVLIAVIRIIFQKDILLLDVIGLGKSRAINLGVNYDKVIRRLLIVVTLYISIATAIVGPISFLGLITANISRELFKTYKHKYLILGSFLSGIIVLVFSQILIEHVFEFSTVITIFINFFGGIYFLYLILKNREQTA